MISMAPSVAASDVAGVYALIALISDPVAAKARLDDMVAAARIAADETQAAAEERARAEVAKVDATLLVQQAVKEKQAAAEERRRAEQALAIVDLKEANLEKERELLREREDAFAAAEADNDARQAEREAALTKRAAHFDALEKAVTDAQRKADELIAEYSGKIAALKKIAE